MDIEKAEGNWSWCDYREGSVEEFRETEFEKILLTPIASLLGKFRTEVNTYL